ncbi:MAG TPA: phosphodiesterase, partial [Thermoplasmata archaeon]|nr:phosphodiesterase [Thermoplasmata archaeon]
GSPLSPDVRPPARIYREVRGDAPDLMIYFRDLKWRSAGTIGYGTFFLAENDTGPDDSVHSFDGVYALAEPGRPGAGPGPTESILDVAPTLLARMGVPVPPTMQGRPIPTLL